MIIQGNLFRFLNKIPTLDYFLWENPQTEAPFWVRHFHTAPDRRDYLLYVWKTHMTEKNPVAFSIDANATEITFCVEAEVFAVNVLGLFFAAVYRRSLY